MVTLVREGGFPMFFLLAFGFATLAFAVRYARSPTRYALRCAVGLGAATLFTTLTAVGTAVAAVGHQVPSYLRAHPETTATEILLQGTAECMSPVILGFTVLSLAALIATLGLYRDDA